MSHHLSLKRLFGLLALAGLTLVALVLTSLHAASQAQQRLVDAYQTRYHSYLLADELRQSSDDLTRMARTYVVTGDPLFATLYRRILAIRDGEHPRPLHYERIYWDFVAAGREQPRPDGEAVALRDLMRAAGFTEQEFAKLAEAQANSDALVRTERRAMDLVRGQTEDGHGGPTHRGEPAPDLAPDPALARRLMHDADYHAFKARIMQPVDEFFMHLDERTAGAVALAQADSQQAYRLVVTLAIGGFVAGMLVLFAVYRWIRRQLGGEPARVRQIVESIASGNLAVEVPLAPDDRQSLLHAMESMRDNLGRMIGEIGVNAVQLGQSAETLATTAGLVAREASSQEGANQSIAAAVEQMSSSVAEITATMEEFSASSTQIADHSQAVVEVANRTLGSSQQGAESMQQLLGRMREISEDNRRGLEEIVALGAKSKEISKVMDLIEAVADQTKLIAFNAALEAASAGESGKRFGVVASEIRRLADSVSASTREIEDRIQEIQDAISRLVMTSEKGAGSIAAGMAASTATGAILDTLVQAASQTSGAARKISLSTQQQQMASVQVVQALHEIAGASGHTSLAVRQITDISEHLLGMSATLRALIRRFRLAG